MHACRSSFCCHNKRQSIYQKAGYCSSPKFVDLSIFSQQKSSESRNRDKTIPSRRVSVLCIVVADFEVLFITAVIKSCIVKVCHAVIFYLFLNSFIKVSAQEVVFV